MSTLTEERPHSGIARMLAAAGEYTSDVWRRRYFWASLVVLDLKLRYKRSWLGIGWSLANPIATTCVLCFVFHSLFSMDLREYAPYVLSGMACWNFLAGAITEGCLCFHNSENYIRSVRVPLAVYPLRSALGLSFHFSLVFLTAIVVTLCARGISHWAPLLSIVPTLLLFVVYAWSAATVFGFINVFFPDVHQLTGIAMQLLFYLTPVFYPADLAKTHQWASLLTLNPFAHFMELIRAPILRGEFPALESCVIAAATTGLVLGLAIFMLRRYERRLIFHL
jgi:lipopolysaccharide transport system permease protein